MSSGLFYVWYDCFFLRTYFKLLSLTLILQIRSFIPQEPSYGSYYDQLPMCSEFLKKIDSRQDFFLIRLFDGMRSSLRQTKHLTCSICILDFKRAIIEDKLEFRNMLRIVDKISKMIKNLDSKQFRTSFNTIESTSMANPDDHLLSEIDNEVLINALIKHDILELNLGQEEGQLIRLSLIGIEQSKKACIYYLEQYEWAERLDQKKRRADTISKMFLVIFFDLFSSLLTALFFTQFKQFKVKPTKSLKSDMMNVGLDNNDDDDEYKEPEQFHDNSRLSDNTSASINDFGDQQNEEALNESNQTLKNSIKKSALKNDKYLLLPDTNKGIKNRIKNLFGVTNQKRNSGLINNEYQPYIFLDNLEELEKNVLAEINKNKADSPKAINEGFTKGDHCEIKGTPQDDYNKYVRKLELLNRYQNNE